MDMDALMDDVDNKGTAGKFKDVENVQPYSGLRKPPAGWKETLPDASSMPALGSELLSGFLRRLPDAPAEPIALVTRLAHLGDIGLKSLSYIGFLSLCNEFPGALTEPPPADVKEFNRENAVGVLREADAAARVKLAPLVETLKSRKKARESYSLVTR